MANVSQEVVLRGARAKERLQNLKNAQPNRPGIRVVPGENHPRLSADQIRKNIGHPRGIKFRPTGSIEWPNDRFTQRRLRDGTVDLAEGGQAQAEQPKRSE